MAKTETKERFEGALLGLAVGDAFGAPVEFMTAQAIGKTHGRLKDMVGGGRFNMKPGEYTDDTKMMLCISESLLDCQGYDPDDIAGQFVSWYLSNPKDIGNTTRKSLERIANGIPWREAGDFNRPANGSVMRCAPIGLFFANDEEKLIKASIETSAMTHAHRNATMSCVFLNMMIARLVSGLRMIEALDYAIMRTREIDDDFNNQNLYCLANPASGLALDTMHLAIGTALGASSFEDVIEDAASLGGDADTIAAIAGALAGAHYGVSAIPERWSLKLNPYSAERIKEIGGELFRLANPG